MRMLTIGQLAARTGLRASALRYYEELGLVRSAARRNGTRIYEEAILDRLAVIDLAKNAGFDLREIARLLSESDGRPPARTWAKVTDAKRLELDRGIAKLSTMKAVLAEIAACNCATLADCGRAFEAARARLPFESTTARGRSGRDRLTRGYRPRSE